MWARNCKLLGGCQILFSIYGGLNGLLHGLFGGEFNVEGVEMPIICINLAFKDFIPVLGL